MGTIVDTSKLVFNVDTWPSKCLGLDTV